jgi:hypothetical protein
MAPPRAVSCLYPMWEDAAGGQAATGYTLLDQSDSPYGPYTSLLSAALTLSHAKHAFVTFQLRALGAGSTGSGPYSSIMDRAEFAVKSENYVKLLAIPSPKESIFIPGSDIVDMSNPDVISFITQVQAVLGDSYGSPWISVAPGVRRRLVER